MNSSSIPIGIWKSSYSYPSSGRGKSFTGEHYVRLHQHGDHLIFESAAETSTSYVVIRLTLQDDIATGSWQEQTEPDGYYKGAVYHGAIQLVVSEGGRKLMGKWVGFGKDMEVNTGPWELSFIGKSLPRSALSEHAVVAS